LAAGEHPAAVAHGQGGALGGLDDPAAAADLQGLAGGAAQDRGEQGHGRLEPGGPVPFVAEAVVARVAAGVVRVSGVVVAAGVLALVAGDQDPGDGPVTGQASGSRGRCRCRRPGGAALEAVQVHRDRQLGPDPTGLGQLAALQARWANSARASARRWLPLPGSLALVGRVSGSRAASRL
jgi:hypothetical protein